MADPVKWDLHYDRRVSEDFLVHFRKGGVAGSLVEYVKHAPYPLDLQMRKDPKRKLAEHASLYVGLTSILNVERAGVRLRLNADKRWMDGGYGFSDSWADAMDEDALRLIWRDVENYVEAVIPDATKEHASREGAVQAAASVFTGRDRVMVDREVALHFRDVETKKRIFADLKRMLSPVLKQAAGVPGTPSFGGECDLLALDSKGRMLAVEVKPRGAGSIAWAAVQSTVYAKLLQMWVDAPRWSTDADAPTAVLNGMLDQRIALGLAPKSAPHLSIDPKVVAVVALQRGAKPVYVKRMDVVRQALLDSGFGPVEVFEVSMAGHLDPLP